MWIDRERPLCTFASLCLQEEQSSPSYAPSVRPSRPSRLSVRLPAWLCVVLPVHRPPPFLPSLLSFPLTPCCLLCVSPHLPSRCDVLCKLEFRHRSKISSLFLPHKSKYKRRKQTHNNKLTLDQCPGATSLLSLSPVMYLTSCMLTPGTLWLTLLSPSHIKDGCRLYFTCVSMVHI